MDPTPHALHFVFATLMDTRWGHLTWGRYRICKGSLKQSWIRRWKSPLYSVVIRDLRDFGSSSPLQRCINPLSLMVESVAIISLRLEHKDPIELSVSSSTREPARLILVRRGKLLKNLMKKPGWIEVHEVKSKLSRLWHFSWVEIGQDHKIWFQDQIGQD